MITIEKFVLLFITLLQIVSAEKYKVCTTPQYLNSCEQLNRTEDLKCILKKNPVNCILMTENGDANFTSVSAEEAFLASSLTTNLIVLGEFIDEISSSQTQYETVIVIRKDLEDGFKSLKGARYCHPGIDTTQVSPLILKEFGREVLLQNNVDICSEDNDKTLSELELQALSNFFGPSCIPGKWSIVNSILDSELKQRYTTLRELCQNNSYHENERETFLESLHCLLNAKGDLALTTLSAVDSYVNKYPSFLNDYALLCKNGSKVNITDKCSWTKQPWPLLIGNKELVADFSQELKNWFRSYLYIPNEPFIENGNLSNFPEKHIQNLKKVIFPNNVCKINVTTTMPNLGTYIKEFRSIPTVENSRLCKSTTRLCTISQKEQQKCKWLRQASLNYGIQPVIDCIPKADRFECLKALQNIAVDFVIVNSSMTYAVSRKNLSIIAFGEEPTEHMKRTILVVKSAQIKSFNDLENKKGCFSEYGDMAWLAFMDILRRNGWNNSSNYGQDLTDFLNESCVPGIQDKEREPYPIGINFDKLCEICEQSETSPTARSCKPDSTNNFYGNDGALRCLMKEGDFAVLALEGDFALPSETAVMCKNGSLAATNSLKIDNECALSITINDEVIVRKFDSKNKDIELLLQELDDRFAGQTHTPFKIFDIFGDQKDLLFKDTTIGAEIASKSNNKYIKTQLELYNNIPKYRDTEQIKTGFATTTALSTSVLFISILIVFTRSFCIMFKY